METTLPTINSTKEAPFEGDLMERTIPAAALRTLVDTFSDGCVMGLNGKWGSGKTTFLKMWEKYMEKLGYKVINEKLECYSRGLSKIICTHFDNEIVELKTELLSELFDNADSMKYDTIYQPILPKEIIKECKDQFYKNVKFIK